ncbi:MAG: hypothetical protein U9O41_07005 [Candidatus Aerophobetes bacterium]|nr:hypothetical protein [Candidatus Aerophobetes bacterium]
MRLKKATLLAIIGIFYVFALRAIGTFSPTIFTNLLITKVTGTISLLARLAIVVFFIYFYKDYVHKEQNKLRIATILVILVSLTGLVAQIPSLSLIFNVNILRYPVMIHHYIDTITPLFSAIFMLIFFVIFYKEIFSKELAKLKKATFLAIIGASVLTLLQIFVLFNYLYYLQFRHPIDVASNKTIIFSIGIPITLFWFLVSLIFFISFYKVQN